METEHLPEVTLDVLTTPSVNKPRPDLPDNHNHHNTHDIDILTSIGPVILVI